MSDIQTRSAFLSDEDELAELDRGNWSPLYAVNARPQAPFDPFFDAGHRPEDYLVGELGGRLAGYIRVVPPTPLPTNAHVLQIQGLVVDPWARGRGLGRALLRAAAELARERGARRLTLRVLGHNAPARRLYEAEGYVVEGVLREEFLLEGRYVDDVLMGLDLTR